MEKKLTFENGMEELESLISKLESGDMPLDESFGAYERAMELYRALNKMLDDGDARIRALTEIGDKDITEEATGE